MTENKEELSVEELTNFCKRKGFVFRSSEIYGGMAGFWDFGPLGVELFNNKLSDLLKMIHNQYLIYKDLESDKEFALSIKDFPYKAVLFA